MIHAAIILTRYLKLKKGEPYAISLTCAMMHDLVYRIMPVGDIPKPIFIEIELASIFGIGEHLYVPLNENRLVEFVYPSKWWLPSNSILRFTAEESVAINLTIGKTQMHPHRWWASELV